jgi:hypothetical protein
MGSDDDEQVADRKSMTADQMRDLALQRLRKQSEFRIQVLFYIAVNGMVVLVWAWSGAALFWPMFPIVAWSIWLAANAWAAYGRRPTSEERIEREVGKLERRGRSDLRS